jgi:hypothetical protein
MSALSGDWTAADDPLQTLELAALAAGAIDLICGPAPSRQLSRRKRGGK